MLLPIGTLQVLFFSLVLVLLWRPVLNVEPLLDREILLTNQIDASASRSQPNAPAHLERSRLQAAVAPFKAEPQESLSRSFERRTFSFADSVNALASLEEVPAPGSQT